MPAHLAVEPVLNRIEIRHVVKHEWAGQAGPIDERSDHHRDQQYCTSGHSPFQKFNSRKLYGVSRVLPRAARVWSDLLLVFTEGQVWK
ncbi:hypothetical protein [Lysobacter gummosus]|uniref:hypothetical protein n=1 Tax=Lysobacter gummosus TaxID=262324 RepID=UPI003644BE2D